MQLWTSLLLKWGCTQHTTLLEMGHFLMQLRHLNGLPVSSEDAAMAAEGYGVLTAQFIRAHARPSRQSIWEGEGQSNTLDSAEAMRHSASEG